MTLLYGQTEMEIYYHYDWIASHMRNRKPFGHTTVEDHLASMHQFMSAWNPETFIQRALEVGSDTKAYIIGILSSHHHPEKAYKSCQGVLSFVPRGGKERLNNACWRSMHKVLI